MNDQVAIDQLRLPSFRHLRVFEAVASCKSVSRAATLMNLSQPAVTQAVTKIEAWTGATLFQRSKTGVFLTPEGEALRESVEHLFARIELALAGELPNATAAGSSAQALSRLKPAHVDVLTAVSSAYSFEDAAHATGVSRTTIQRTAREVETILGCELYERAPQGLVATERTRKLAAGLQRACREFCESVNELAWRSATTASRIYIGAQPLASRALIAAAINGVLTAYPHATIRIIEGTYPFLLGELRSGHLDLMFGALQKPHSVDDVIEEPLYDEPYCVVARAGHPLSAKASISRDDLAQVDWVLPGPGTQRRWAFEQLFKGYEKVPSCSINTTSVSAQVALVTTSDRVTLLTRTELELELRMSGLVALPVEMRIARTADGITMRADWKMSPIQKCFIDALREHIRRLGLKLSSPKATARNAGSRGRTAAGERFGAAVK